MNSVTTEAGSFDKEVFESVIDTIAGGGTLEVTGYVNADNVIPAGTMVGAKNTTTGLHNIVTVAAGVFTGGNPVGFVHATIPLVTAGNNVVGIVTEGAYRVNALPAVPVAASIAAMKTEMPNMRAVL